MQPELDWRPRIRFIDVVRFLLASLLTSLSMRLLPLRSVMDECDEAQTAGIATFGSVDVAIARRATGAFIRICARCCSARRMPALYDSLALARFLSYYGQYPACVIGVQTAPFGAHCWVQEAGLVFNDEPEYVRRFPPILLV